MMWLQPANLIIFVRYELIVLVAAMVLSVTHRLLVGSINTKGLLQDKNDSGGISPARVQLLMLTGSVALYYLLLVLQTLETRNQPFKLPELPNELLLVLGGSHTFYLGAKAASARKTIADAPDQPTSLLP
jgi:hypothetical protein